MVLEFIAGAALVAAGPVESVLASSSAPAGHMVESLATAKLWAGPLNSTTPEHVRLMTRTKTKLEKPLALKVMKNPCATMPAKPSAPMAATAVHPRLTHSVLPDQWRPAGMPAT